MLYLAVEPPTGTVIVWLAESVLHLVINGVMGVSLTVMVTVRVWVPAWVPALGSSSTVVADMAKS